MTDEALLSAKRDEYHAGLIEAGTLTVNDSGIASNADGANRLSISVAGEIAASLSVQTQSERAAGQTLGGNFETATQRFLDATFPQLSLLRPGAWTVRKVGNRGGLSTYEPYAHLADLQVAIDANPELQAVLGNGYAISPDVVITRMPETDDAINASARIVDDLSARHSVLRRSNSSAEILHAVVSCKWTLRSDRAQNARSEALNLIRNRKGRVPHIVVVTAEPTPSRLSSLALGTGDIDCVYHVALPELQQAVRRFGNDDNVAQLDVMVAGQRLKDITDLPLDLAI